MKRLLFFFPSVFPYCFFFPTKAIYSAKFTLVGQIGSPKPIFGRCRQRESHRQTIWNPQIFEIVYFESPFNLIWTKPKQNTQTIVQHQPFKQANKQKHNKETKRTEKPKKTNKPLNQNRPSELKGTWRVATFAVSGAASVGVGVDPMGTKQTTRPRRTRKTVIF